MTAGTTTAVSVTPGNTMSAGTVTQMVFSPNSQLLAFVSTGTDLTTNAPDTPLAASSSTGPSLPKWYASNVFVRNLATGATTAGSVTAGGELSNGFVGDLELHPRQPVAGLPEQRRRLDGQSHSADLGHRPGQW